MTVLSLNAPVAGIDALYSDEAAWEKGFLKLTAELSGWNDEPIPLDGPDLLDWLRRLDDLQRLNGRLSTYIGIQSFVDNRDAHLQATAARLRTAAATLGRKVADINGLLAVTDRSTWNSWCSSAPGLLAYQGRYLQVSKGRAHFLGADVERVLASVDATIQLPLQIYRRIKAGDVQFGEVIHRDGRTEQFSFSRYEKSFETSTDSVLRKSAFDVFVKGIQSHRHGLAATYNGEVSKQMSLARLRGFGNTMDYLFHLQGISRQYFEAQRSAFNSQLPALMRRFVEIKRRLLNIPRLSYHDLKAYPPQVPQNIDFEDARDLIIKAGEALGTEYATVLRQAFDENWIEHGQQPNKADSSGCASPFGPHPFVLMTWTGTPRDMFLLAHELGHAVHFHWSANNQAVLNAAPLRYFIEAPSTFNELLLADYLLGRGDDIQRFSAVYELLNSYFHNFVTHYLESELQLRVYEAADAGRIPGADKLVELKTDVLRTFWGNGVEISDEAGLTWTRPHHYFMGLYPYTYAAGQSIATLYLDRIKSDDKAATRWCDALRLGSSVDAETLLSQLGIDMRNPTAFEQVLRVISNHIDVFEQLAQPYITNERTI